MNMFELYIVTHLGLFIGLSKLFAPSSDGDTTFHPSNIHWYQGLNVFNFVITFFLSIAIIELIGDVR